MLHQPFYDPTKSYEENFEQGPSGEFANAEQVTRTGTPEYAFLGHSVYTPFGIPAGPLPTSEFVAAAFRKGFDICTYKTVRSRAYETHPAPNILAVKVDGDLTLERSREPVVANDDYSEPLSITNSFGVPSKDPDYWQPDMEKAIASAGEGQVMIGSFQGTRSPDGNAEKFVQDYALAAKLVKETGAKILEANLSCPNEGTTDLVCFDIPRVQAITEAIKNEIGDTPLILKLGYFKTDAELEKLVSAVGQLVAGLATINTIPAPIVDVQGEQALKGEGRLVSGVCGASIKWAGLEMVSRLKKIKQQHQHDFAIIGVGGVLSAADVEQYLSLGADAVQSATGAMWNPFLGQEVYERLHA